MLGSQSWLIIDASGNRALPIPASASAASAAAAASLKLLAASGGAITACTLRRPAHFYSLAGQGCGLSQSRTCAPPGASTGSESKAEASRS